MSGPVHSPDAVADAEAGKRGWSQYPHIVLYEGPYRWTSVHVALIKSRLPAAEWSRRAPLLPPKRTPRQWLGKRAYPVVARLRKLRQRFSKSA